MTFDDALGMLKVKFPKEDWDTREHLDETQGVLIRRALQANIKPHMHKIYAEIVAAEPDAFEGCGFGLKYLFKYRGKGEYYYYDLGTKAWTTYQGRYVLLTVICDVLGRRMNSWTFDAKGVARYHEANTQFYSVSLAESVENSSDLCCVIRILSWTERIAGATSYSVTWRLTGIWTRWLTRHPG